MLFVIKIEAHSSKGGLALKAHRICSSEAKCHLVGLPGGKLAVLSGNSHPALPFPLTGLGTLV